MKFRHRIQLLLPDWLDEGIRRPLGALRQRRSRDVLLERIVGQCGESGDPIEVLTTGRTTTIDYLLQRFLTDRMEYVERRRLPASSIGQALQEYPNADLTIARCSGRDGSDGPSSWRIPDSVVSIIDLDPAIVDIKSHHGNTDSLRRIKKHRLSACVSHDLKELGDFVQNAYVPHIRSRFGDLARPHSELTVARAFGSGGLLWVLQDGVRLAGVVFSVKGDTICSRIAAPASNTELAVRAHAVSATKKFLIMPI